MKIGKIICTLLISILTINANAQLKVLTNNPVEISAKYLKETQTEVKTFKNQIDICNNAKTVESITVFTVQQENILTFLKETK